MPYDSLYIRPWASVMQVAGALVRARRTRSRSSRCPHRRRAQGPRRGDSRTPPSAQIDLPTARAASAHSSTALNCGRPTPVIIRVVHMAPGPTPTLTTSAPASTRSVTPSAVTTLPATSGIRTPPVSCRRSRTSRTDFSACSILLLVPVRGVDHQHVDAGSEQCLRPRSDVPVDPDRGTDHQPAGRIQRRPIERGAQTHASGSSPRPAGRRPPPVRQTAGAWSAVEDLLRRGCRTAT